MKTLIQYGAIGAIVLAFIFFTSDKEDDLVVVDDLDLNQILDVTVDTIYAFEEKVSAIPEDQRNEDAAFVGFAADLQVAYNEAQPAIHTTAIGVSPQEDASVYAYEDTNANGEFDEGEDPIFLVEIDGENSRVIATSRAGGVSDHRFSGTGFLTGYLIASMLNRQRAAGAASRVASKKTMSATQAARARAGSGSHSRGK